MCVFVGGGVGGGGGGIKIRTNEDGIATANSVFFKDVYMFTNLVGAILLNVSVLSKYVWNTKGSRYM